MAGGMPRASTKLAPNRIVRRRRAWINIGSNPTDWLDSLWSLFTSQRLALTLIILIAVASLIGVILVQAPASALENSISYARWLILVQPKYGPATDVFSGMGFFHVFSTWWFRLLMGMLSLNISACSLNRAGPRLRAALNRPRVVLPSSFYERATAKAEIQITGLHPDEIQGLLQTGIRKSGYRAVTDRTAEGIHAHGVRNRFAPLGSIIHHISLVILLGGFVIGGMWGYRDDSFIVSEGSTRLIGTTGLALQLEGFYDEYYPEGAPKDYRSDVTLLDEGEVVRQGTVRVNDPMIHKGVRVHQSFFGPAAVIEVRDLSGTLVAAETVPLAWRTQDRPVGSFVIPSLGREVYVVASASEFIDSAIRPGEMRVEVYQSGTTAPYAMANITQGQPQEVGDLVYTFVRERSFSGFSIVSDPGRPILWIGAIGFLLGLMWVLYFPTHQFWTMAVVTSGGGLTVRLGAASGKHGEFQRSLARIAERIANEAAKSGAQARAVEVT